MRAGQAKPCHPMTADRLDRMPEAESSTKETLLQFVDALFVERKMRIIFCHHAEVDVCAEVFAVRSRQAGRIRRHHHLPVLDLWCSIWKIDPAIEVAQLQQQNVCLGMRGTPERHDCSC